MRADPTPEPGDRDRPPFSNGTMGETWTANVCGSGDGCIHDTSYGQSDEYGDEWFCPLITLSMMGVWPHEWAEREVVTSTGSYTVPGDCSEYTDVHPVEQPEPVIAVDLFGIYAAEPRAS